MLTIKRSRESIALDVGLCLFCVAGFLWCLLSMGEDPGARWVFCTGFGIPLLYFLWMIPEVGAEYVLDTSGITIRPLIGKERFYPWEDFPYRYVIRMTTKGNWYKRFVFSREPISYYNRKRLRLSSRRRPKALELSYAAERERFLRELLPGNGLSYLGKMTGPMALYLGDSRAEDVYTPADPGEERK